MPAPPSPSAKHDLGHNRPGRAIILTANPNHKAEGATKLLEQPLAATTGNRACAPEPSVPSRPVRSRRRWRASAAEARRISRFLGPSHALEKRPASGAERAACPQAACLPVGIPPWDGTGRKRATCFEQTDCTDLLAQRMRFRRIVVRKRADAEWLHLSPLPSISRISWVLWLYWTLGAKP